MTNKTPLYTTYWVVPDRFLAGPSPLRIPADNPIAVLQELVKLGINTFINLTFENDVTGASYQHLLRSLPENENINYYNLPIEDFNIPTKEGMREILDTIKKEMDNGNNIYLHCFGGIGRTGTVVGCYLVEQGMTGNQALTQIINLRKTLGYVWGGSPETDEQIQFVLNWQTGWLKEN